MRRKDREETDINRRHRNMFLYPWSNGREKI